MFGGMGFLESNFLVVGVYIIKNRNTQALSRVLHCVPGQPTPRIRVA